MDNRLQNDAAKIRKSVMKDATRIRNNMQSNAQYSVNNMQVVMAHLLLNFFSTGLKVVVCGTEGGGLLYHLKARPLKDLDG